MDRRPLALPLLAITLLAGCSTIEETSLPSFTTQPVLDDMLTCLASQENLSLSQRSQLLGAVSKSESIAAGPDRFQYACLLGHTQASDDELKQAQQLLNTLSSDPEFAATERQAVISIYQRKLELMLALRQQVTETREYRRKIEQLKGLEEELETEAPVPTELPEVTR